MCTSNDHTDVPSGDNAEEPASGHCSPEGLTLADPTDRRAQLGRHIAARELAHANGGGPTTLRD